MALLGWELKKIWRPGLLLAIAVLGVVFYSIRTGFFLEYFRGNGSQDAYQLSVGWLEQYGTTMEPEEREKLDGQLEQMKEKFAQQVADIQGATQAGITDYASYLAWEQAYSDKLEQGTDTQEEDTLKWAIFYDTNSRAIQTMTEFMARYDRLAAGGSKADWGDDMEGDTPFQAAERQRIQDMQAEGFRGFLPSTVLDYTDEFFHYFAIWCVFSVVLLLSPTLVRDRLHRTRATQWASRRGRKVWMVQMGAALLSAMVLTLLNCAAYLGPFLSTGALQFWDCHLVSVWSFHYPWFDWSYGQYLLALLGLTVLLALAAAGCTVVLSQFSGSYVAMLLKAIPLVVVLCWGVVPWLTSGAALFSNRLVGLVGVPGAEFACGALLVALGVGLCVWTCAGQRRRDLVE